MTAEEKCMQGACTTSSYPVHTSQSRVAGMATDKTFKLNICCLCQLQLPLLATGCCIYYPIHLGININVLVRRE